MESELPSTTDILSNKTKAYRFTHMRIECCNDPVNYLNYSYNEQHIERAKKPDEAFAFQLKNVRLNENL